MNEEITHTYEHCQIALPEEELIELLRDDLPKLIESIDFKNGFICTGYFVGLQRLKGGVRSLYVAPKFDTNSAPTNYLKMLSSCLRHPATLGHTKELFDIDLKSAPITINQAKDLITPLIVVQFLRIVSQIVKKGLQKGYYPITENKRSTIKGKVLIAKTIKQNHLKNKNLYTWCNYQEFGLNNPQNRLLKKALQFVQHYSQVAVASGLPLNSLLNYVNPAFEFIRNDFDPREIKQIKYNPFFSEYNDAVKLAKILLKRFGYQLNSVQDTGIVEVPPFWIDMSKLFELFVFCKLHDALTPGDIIYQAKGNYGELDFLKTTAGEEIIIDAKYKPHYAKGNYDIDNIRQLSAYARDKGLLKKLSIHPGNWGFSMLSCLIIHPDQTANENLLESNLLDRPITEFERFYKVGIFLPVTEVDK